MKKPMLFLVCLLLFLTACSAIKQSPAEKTLEPLEIQVKVPETAALSEEIQIKAVVMQGGEPVDDPEEIQFEIWKNELKESSQMLQARAEGKGVYTATHSFTEKAIYTIQAHVTARGFHTMPKTTVLVGGAELKKSDNKKTAF